MRVKNNDFDMSILGEMDSIMSSKEHQEIFSPIKKEAQFNPGGSFPGGGVAGGVAKEMSQNQLDAAKIPTQPTTITPPALTPEYIKSILQDILTSPVAPNVQAAAQQALKGTVNAGSVTVLLPHFPGQNAQSLESAIKGLASKVASVSTVIPVIVKIADQLGKMGFELSELVADKLLQTITIEAKAKVVEQDKKGKKVKVDEKGKKDEPKKEKTPKDKAKTDEKNAPKDKGKCDVKKGKKPY